MIYPNIRKEIFRAANQDMIDGWIKNSNIDFWTREVILVNGNIICVKINLSLVHVLARKNLFEHRHHIPQHLALPGLPTHIHQKDIGLLWRNLVVNSK